MRTYFLKRLLMLVPTFFGITLITFLVIQLAPGDPATLKAQGAKVFDDRATETIIRETRAMYGLDQPLFVQYGRWVGRLVRFDFGESFEDHRPVIQKISRALPVTLLLNVTSLFVVYLIALPLGFATALRPRGMFDRISMIGTFILYALPIYWSALLLLLVFATGDWLNWFPIGGLSSLGASSLPGFSRIANVVWHMVLPTACLSLGSFAFLSRFSRSAFLGVLREDYITSVRAKGVSERRILLRHVLRNALIPLVTLSAALLPGLLGGSVIVEQIFAIPGMGRLGFHAVLARDYPVIMAVATIGALLTLLSMLIADLLYAWIDPRISYEKMGEGAR